MGVGLAVATADVLPIDEGIARSHQGLVDVVAALEDLGNAPAIAIRRLCSEG